MATIRETLEKHLRDRGLGRKDVQAVMDLVVVSPLHAEQMKGRWDSDTACYPTNFLGPLLSLASGFALEYIDAHCPSHVARHNFVPEGQPGSLSAEDDNAATENIAAAKKRVSERPSTHNLSKERQAEYDRSLAEPDTLGSTEPVDPVDPSVFDDLPPEGVPDD